MAIPAGKLDRRVTIFAPGAVVDDGFTDRPGDAEEAGSRLAWVKPVRGSERFEAEGREGKRVMRFWFRSDSLTRTITEEHALELDGRRYQITGIETIGRREGVEVQAVAAD